MHLQPNRHTSFEALRLPQYRHLVIGFLLTMMADNVEHVISYWVMFEKFNSPVLGGFAVLSHWIPFLVFSLPAGALADRYDPRRLIQVGLIMFMGCSAAWAYLLMTDTLTVGLAMFLLVIHGLSGVFWSTATQIILYDLVGQEVLPSAVRTLATARYVGLIVGPGVGGGLMIVLGPEYGLLANCLLYVPHFIWLIHAPCGPQFRPANEIPPARPFRGIEDLLLTLKEIVNNRQVWMMTLLAGGASFFVANSYQAQMPAYANDMGLGDPGMTYSMLLAADAMGALCAGLLWEFLGSKSKPTTSKAMFFALVWAVSLAAFALSNNYILSLVVLFVAGFAELTSNSAAQTIVQLQAPIAFRGRIIGLFNMSALGLRFGSGLCVGVLGGVIGNHESLFVACAVFVIFLGWLNFKLKLKSHG
ncbi:MFS transporter [Limnohabitans sp.]|uniref:MFS transporter n=1 Tax=Limnohabitans sp. TaxID=1907725 RepID=UPI0038B71B32